MSSLPGPNLGVPIIESPTLAPSISSTGFAFSTAFSIAPIISPWASFKDIVAPEMLSSSAFCSSVSLLRFSTSSSFVGLINGLPLRSEHDVAKNSLISWTVLPLKNSSNLSISSVHVPLFILYAEPLSRFVFQAEIVLTKSSSVSKSSVSAVPSPSISAE